MHNGELGFWWRSLGGPPQPRPSLAGPEEVDVAIVGAGNTGLWSAYYLKRARPELEIAVLEREMAGFGASGRNGGWVSGFFSGASSPALQRAMFATVDEIARVVAEERIDADLVKPGQLSVATSDVQARRLQAQVAATREGGVGEQDLCELDAAELALRVRVAGARAATFTPHVGRVQPAKLVRGLAAAVERLGVRIYERTPVSELRPHAAVTRAGAVSARWVVRATEGYTARLPGMRRLLVPLNSSMIVSEPLSARAWEEICLEECELLDDAANAYVYLQRTADGRIAIGGRGVPYRFGSRAARRLAGSDGATDATTVASLTAKLHEMFPATRTAAIDHAWSGVLGVPRDWCVSVGANSNGGLAWAGGYSGLGVAASNLAARTLRDLVLGERTELTALPWVGHRSPRWEPEPLRWCAIRGVWALYRAADDRERRGGRPSVLARVADRVSGRGH